MTKAYLIGQITVTNPEGYAHYASQVPQTIAAFGGKYLVRGGQATQLEGLPQGDRNVVVEFPSREAAAGATPCVRASAAALIVANRPTCGVMTSQELALLEVPLFVEPHPPSSPPPRIRATTDHAPSKQ